MASEQLEEFERLNTTTQSIHDLEGNKVIIILKDGTNLTSWEDVENRDDVIYVSEDLSDYKNLSEKYMDLRSARAIVAFGLSDRVRSMRHMFAHCESLVDLSGLAGLDVSHITDMEAMFVGCYSLTDLTPLAGWDVSNVRSMNWMFESCCRLTSLDGLDSWDVSGADSMMGTFCDCYLDDISSLSGWDVSNVTNMSVLFGIAISEHKFNGKGNPITDLSPIASWDVSNLKDMWSMFRGAFKLKDLTPLAGWDVSNVEDMSRMFAQCRALHDLSGLEGWDVSGVKDFSSMFVDCSNLESLGAISGWKVSKEARMDDLFKGCSQLSDVSCLNSWDLGSVNMYSLFDECPLLLAPTVWMFRPKPARRFNPFEELFRRVQKHERGGFRSIAHAVSLGSKKITFTSDIVFNPMRDSNFINGILLGDDDLLIDGDGHTIDAKGLSRVFEVTGKNITIRNFTFLNCRADNGGAIINRGTLRLENVKFSTCEADFGGAICNASGEIVMDHIEFSANMAEYGGGSIHNDGGHIMIFNSLIHQSKAQYGSAISNSCGMIDIRYTGIHRNRASHRGAAIVNDGGRISISTSDLHENASEGLGVVVNGNGDVRIMDCDIRTNSSKDNIVHNTGRLEINNCLLRQNRSKGIIFNDRDGHFKIVNAEFLDNLIEESVVYNNGCESLIEKTLFADNLSHDEAMNIINMTYLTLEMPKIKDCGVTILNEGHLLIKGIAPDKIINKVKSERQLGTDGTGPKIEMR